MKSRDVFITFDLEQDCPPFLDTYRGMERGFAALMEVLAETSVKATFFCTGEVAQQFPHAVRELVSADHELGCHGMTHRKFTTMTEAEASWEIRESCSVLRGFDTVESFRAPYLSFPNAYLPLLEANGIKTDSSQAAYKLPARREGYGVSSLRRVRATIPPSAIRLPGPIRSAWLRVLSAPVVLFFHPWEFVDFRRAPLPLDCRFATGAAAVRSLRETLLFYRDRGWRFRTLRSLE